MAPPLLTLRDIHLTFGATPLLTGADMIVGSRERLCLVGRNGSGKSTLLKIAAGHVEMDQGSKHSEDFCNPDSFWKETECWVVKRGQTTPKSRKNKTR